ncbi:ICE2-domain-containing protein [Pyronema domesticum]|nr:ICE2-domain-containing protein [Pyronema domesticum]
MSFVQSSIRILAGVTFLALVILFIPLAFDVGGRDCGLLYSLSLAIFYFLLSTARLAVPRSQSWRGARMLLGVVEVLQYTVVIPGLLIYALNKFSDDDDGGGGSAIERLVGETTRVADRSDRTQVDKLTIGPWDTFLTFSTPMFQLSEGFCSLLVIQALGQISRWLVNRKKKSDTWMIMLLIIAASTISNAVYFLWRITNFPEIGNIDATLIGVSITCAVFLSAYGILSGRGNPIESSLLFAYIVLCVYQIFTDYQPSHPPPPIEKAEFPPFPPMIMTSYESLVSSLSSFLPEFLQQIGTFVISAYSTITPSVIVSLAFRLFVFYASTRIIPAVRETGGTLSRIAGIFACYSPCILVAVYTHLLLQHFEGENSGGEGGAAGWVTGVPVGGHVWRWINIGATMLLYSFELIMGDESEGEALTSHWKTD